MSVPGSKSITNRVLLLAALADGRTRLTGALRAGDTAAMSGAVSSLGAVVDWSADTSRVDLVDVIGIAGARSEAPTEVDCGDAATVARFLAPVVAAGQGPVRLDGSEQLRARPMAPLIDALRRLGATVDDGFAAGHLPFEVRGPIAGGAVTIGAQVSSQFPSGLLLAGPLLSQGIEVRIAGPVTSGPFLRMTVALLQRFGAHVDAAEDLSRVTVRPGPLRPPPAGTFPIEPDATAASYFWAVAAITGGRVSVEGLHRDALQGDSRFPDVLGLMGCRIEDGDGGLAVTGGQLKGVDVDLTEMPDTAQTLAVVAPFASTPTRVRGIASSRGKETDRIASVVTELRGCGVRADEHDDGFTVHPGRPRPAVVRTYGDHRMAMAFGLLGLVIEGLRVDDPTCVAKTFPGYFDALDQLR